MTGLSSIHSVPVEQIATATLSVETAGEGFFEITRDVARFLKFVAVAIDEPRLKQ